MSGTESKDLEDLVRPLGIQDVFIFRRVAGERFVHVGGVGRGEGWAGLTEINLADNAAARRAYDENQVTVVDFSSDCHVFGPYWSRWGAFVPVNRDVMVIFGRREDHGPGFDLQALRSAALEAAEEIEVVSPAKRLADELEILHAVQKVMEIEPTSSKTTMQHIIDCATEALSCEFGLVWMRHRENWAASQRGWRPTGDIQDAVGTLRELNLTDDSPLCIQNTLSQSLSRPFRAEDGVCSYYLLPIGDQATMLLVHTRVEPRGFTQLCQELGRRLAESSDLLLRTATQRERLTRELDRVSSEARRDPLTGIANRLAWEERLATFNDKEVLEPVGILYVDINNLKQINDDFGHEAGDAVIRAMADILRDNVRPNDLVARLGGDEFAALLPETDRETCAGVISRLRAAAETSSTPYGSPIRFTHGSAVCVPGGDVREALLKADASLIEAKKSRKS